MRPQVKPLLIALALALAGTGTAWAQSDSALSGSAGTAYSPTHTRSDTGVAASPTASPAPRLALGGDDAQERAARSVGADQEEHGGLRNRLHRGDDADEHAARDALHGGDPATAASDDAQERATRAAAVNTEDEEHGGLRNRVRNFFHHDASPTTYGVTTGGGQADNTNALTANPDDFMRNPMRRGDAYSTAR